LRERKEERERERERKRKRECVREGVGEKRYVEREETERYKKDVV